MSDDNKNNKEDKYSSPIDGIVFVVWVCGGAILCAQWVEQSSLLLYLCALFFFITGMCYVYFMPAIRRRKLAKNGKEDFKVSLSRFFLYSFSWILVFVGVYISYAIGGDVWIISAWVCVWFPAWLLPKIGKKLFPYSYEKEKKY